MKTTKQEALRAKIEANKELCKAIEKVNSYYTRDNFISDAQAYIKAIRERRMLCLIKSVAPSGMSRILKYASANKAKSGFYYRNYNCLFIVLGYTEVRDRDGFRIHGCGMDMNFHTNYTNIHSLQRLGFISKKQCEKLAQETPVIL